MNCKKVFPGLFALCLASCNDYGQQTSAQTTTENKLTADTIVGSKTMIDEIAGSAYLKRAIGYFVIVGKDTSEYTCIFTESKDGGKVGIDMNISYFKPAMTYQQRLAELRTILPKAAKDFILDSRTSISFGRLILSGDLAVEVTKQYRQRYGSTNRLESYTAVAHFLKESMLGTDLNMLFKPYSMTVDKISIEKLFFTSRKELYWASKIEADTLAIPDRILDCSVWVKMKQN